MAPALPASLSNAAYDWRRALACDRRQHGVRGGQRPTAAVVMEWRGDWIRAGPGT